MKVSEEDGASYIVDPDRIESDGRTALYIRNIPNKYTLKMMMDTINKNYGGQYDFFYLPMDSRVWFD